MAYLNSLFRLFLWLSFVCITAAISANDLNGGQLLQKSIKRHDPDNRWNLAQFKLHIQEPRLANSLRFSIVKLDNATGAFHLDRSRQEQISSHIVDAKGISQTLLDGEIENDPTRIKKYRLEPERNSSYKKFYYTMLGLPMSLNGDAVKKFGETEQITFNKEDSYKIRVELKDGVFSNHWNIFIAVKDYRMLGVEMFFPKDLSKGERLYFDKEIMVEGMSLTRMRHWHGLLDDHYTGSDIIMKTLD